MERTTTVADDVVMLRIPASTERVRLARTLVATLGDEAGFDFDEVEDLRIAVDELCFLLLDQQATGEIQLVGRSSEGQLVIEGSCPIDGTAEGSLDAIPELTGQILATVIDDYEVGAENGSARFRFTKTKP
jgi:hypothetical protein